MSRIFPGASRNVASLRLVIHPPGSPRDVTLCVDPWASYSRLLLSFHPWFRKVSRIVMMTYYYGWYSLPPVFSVINHFNISFCMQILRDSTGQNILSKSASLDSTGIIIMGGKLSPLCGLRWTRSWSQTRGISSKEPQSLPTPPLPPAPSG